MQDTGHRKVRGTAVGRSHAAPGVPHSRAPQVACTGCMCGPAQPRCGEPGTGSKSAKHPRPGIVNKRPVIDECCGTNAYVDQSGSMYGTSGASCREGGASMHALTVPSTGATCPHGRPSVALANAASPHAEETHRTETHASVCAREYWLPAKCWLACRIRQSTGSGHCLTAASMFLAPDAGSHPRTAKECAVSFYCMAASGSGAPEGAPTALHPSCQKYYRKTCEQSTHWNQNDLCTKPAYGTHLDHKRTHAPHKVRPFGVARQPAARDPARPTHRR